jgi:hypothetical protein
MSRTRKDSAKVASRYLRVVRRDDGTCDLFLNRDCIRGKISKWTLRDELCVTWGYCGGEGDQILSEVTQNGSKRILM